MARNVAALCAERHFMGSSSSGRYATDRSRRPDYELLPDEETLAQWAACQFANRARYLREQDAAGLVAACEAARAELDVATEKLARLRAAQGQLNLAEEPELYARLQEAALWLEAHVGQTLARRRELSGQLRALGISPKEQAAIWRALQQRGYSQAAQTSGW